MDLRKKDRVTIDNFMNSAFGLGFLVNQLVHIQLASGKARLAIAKVNLPQPQKPLLIPLIGQRPPVGQKALPPKFQGLAIVAAKGEAVNAA
jgi:hypothetical protein